MCGSGDDDAGENTVGVVEYCVVGETNNPETLGFEGLLTLTVFADLLIVDGAINFDDKATGRTEEVHNEAGDHVLAAENEAIGSKGPEKGPECRFGRGH